MAVKQHVTELAPSQPKYDIFKIIELIEMLQANPDSIPSNASLLAVCEEIVLHLAHTPAGREVNEIKLMKPEIGKICQFFRDLEHRAPEHYSDIVSTCLTKLYKHILIEEEVSNYGSAILVLVDKARIKPGVQWILQEAENPNAIKKIFKTLAGWLETNDFAPDLTTWVVEILNGLRDQQKNDILLELSLDIINSYFKKLSIPLYQPKLGPVVLCILKSIRHTPVVFHQILPKAPKILQDLSKTEKSIGNSSNLLLCFVDTLSALILHFPTYDNRYKELEECLQQYPRSENFCQALDIPKSKSYNFQNISVVPTNAKVGLVNLGNTCYMNSVLQALVMTKQFSREILLSKIDEPLFFQIQKLLALLLHSDRPELTPRALLVAARPPDFVPGYQQDSSEFLGYLLEKLHEQERKMYLDKKPWNSHDEKQLLAGNVGGSTAEESKSHPTKPQPSESMLPPTLIQKTFDGKLFVTYQCGVCGSKSTNLDAFRSFELSFPESTNMSNYTVQKLLDYYCSSEKLIGDNQYYCDNCKQLCDGERSIRIIKSPKNLILTLKHFQYDQQRHTRAKLMNKVLHDEIISLRVVPELEPASVVRYSLYAAVVHAGTSMDSGHYYTYAQDKPDCWYKFNDNFVTKVSEDELHAFINGTCMSKVNTPYILFYQLIPTTEGGINSNSLDLDDEMESSVNLGTAVTDCQLPQLEDLPLHLREIVHGDNQSYNDEIRSENRKKIHQRAVGTNKFMLPRNHDSDKDDPPPSSCGGSSVDYSNRFIY